MSLKVLSWNIWIKGNFQGICDFLDAADADIIGLQEVTADDPAFDVIGHLSKRGYEYVFAPVKKVWDGVTYNDGPALFSRYPIHSSEKYLLSDVDTRAAARADIEIDGQILHVFNTHLIHTHQHYSKAQETQADDLLKLVPNERTIVMGDFNATPESVVIQKMKKALIDSDPASQPTWSVYKPGCETCNPERIDTRLDYIFTTPDLKTSGFKVEESKASDHLPISVTVEL